MKLGPHVDLGAEGELCIAGPSVLQGYWHLPEQTASAFLPGREQRWYKTGDIVAQQADGNFRFLGRRDRMVKERVIVLSWVRLKLRYRHPKVKQAAVISLPDESGLRIKAFVSSTTGTKLSVIDLKSFALEFAPVHGP